MKISVIITTLLIGQVSASLFDVFQGAVLSVQNSFEKLLSDVVTDVKDTVDCTILAVEHVLSLSNDATSRYYGKCGSTLPTNKTDLLSDVRQDRSLPKVEVTLNFHSNEEYLEKAIPAVIDANINETLSKVLGNYKPNENVLSVKNVLAKESEQMTGVSNLVKKELKKLTNHVNTDFMNTKHNDSEPSVDTILQEIKLLEKKENSINISEANKNHEAIVEVLEKLDAIKATEATENIKLKEILKDLENNSNNRFVGLRQQFEEWKEEESKHLGEIKDNIEKEQNFSDHLGPYNKHESNYTQPVTLTTDMNKDAVTPTSNSFKISSNNTIPVKETSQNTFNGSGLNDTVITNTSLSLMESLFGSEIIHLFESTTAIGSLSANQYTHIQNNVTGDYSNETKITLPITDSTPINATIQSVKTSTDVDKQDLSSFATNELTPKLSINENNSNETVIINNPLLAAVSILLSDISQPVTNNTDSGKSESYDDTIHTAIANSAKTIKAKLTSTTQYSLNSSNDIRITSTANTMEENASVNATNAENVESSILATNELATTITTFIGIESNDTFITSTSSSINSSVRLNETIPPIESITAFGNDGSSTVTTKIINDNDFNDTMMASTSLLAIESKSVSKTVLPVETTTASGKEESTTTIVYDNDLNDFMTTSSSLLSIKSTPLTGAIKSDETATAIIDEESSTVRTKIVHGNDSNDNIMTSTSFPIIENTPVSETIEETRTTSGDEESSTVITIVIHSNDTITASTSLPIIESSPVTDSIQSEETISASLEESSTVTVKITSTSLPIEQNTLLDATIQPTETIMTSGNEEELTTTSKIVEDNDSSDIITSTSSPIVSTLVSETIKAVGTTTSTATEESSILTVNKPTGILKTLDDDVGATETSTSVSIAESISEDSNANALSSTPFPATKNTLVSEIQSVENTAPITKGVLTDLSETSTFVNRDPKWVTPDRLILNVPNQQSFIEIDAQQHAVFDANDSMRKRLPKSESSFVSDEEILKLADVPTKPVITNGQRKPIDPQGINYENPPYMPTSTHPIRLPSSFDRASANIHTLPRGSTTHRPTGTAARANNYKTLSMDYDSFFQPQKDSEAHQRALREALGLIENSKRSDRIINSILKNKDTIQKVYLTI